mmetsp:Transcript_27122/g.78267  ORF Transcript_27122/g.78267 Transcript_27122/m.78267 type:complete len:88 (-) Transcript_27122:573-836(-)
MDPYRRECSFDISQKDDGLQAAMQIYGTEPIALSANMGHFYFQGESLTPPQHLGMILMLPPHSFAFDFAAAHTIPASPIEPCEGNRQ